MVKRNRTNNDKKKLPHRILKIKQREPRFKLGMISGDPEG